MKGALQVIAEAIRSKDVLLEVLDARMPLASTNPVLVKLRRDKPCLKILSKSDLADPGVTQAWIRFFAADAEGGRVRAIALTSAKPAETRARIAAACRELAPHRTGRLKPLRAMIVGIPNVGKSTLLNTLMQRKVARVGNEPAVTTTEQVVTLKDGMTLSDNPGVLWPRMDERATLRLALGGAVPDTAMDYESVALFGATFFLERYPELVCARLDLQAAPRDPHELLDAVGRRHGCLKSGGVVDRYKAADVLVHAFRAGKLGRISLEAPGDDDVADDVAEDG
jgi:ribosome biogenesis GTPase A